ncbi:MAG TPA: polyribonucleotide nucleotidyltransferase [Acidimicrobiaceae bacterium]|nr:polyribonucleotide nucleotidyltransferase [Acidimicrobiaceae bacterium]
MAEAISVSSAIGAEEKVLSLETGVLAGQANGSVVVTIGRTKVLVTATSNKNVRPGTDFFPLTVDFEERNYAAGKIPGSFFRREGRASETAILACRLTDRPLRPLFPEGFRNDVHIVATVLGADQENPYDVPAINAASAALCISDIPFQGPLGCVRIAYDQNGEWISLPTYEEGEESTFEMVVAGRLLDDGDVAVMMVEAGGTPESWKYYEEGAPKVDEGVLAAGLEFAKGPIKDAISLQSELVQVAGAKETMEVEIAVDYSEEIYAAVEEEGADLIAESQKIADKTARGEAEALAASKIKEGLLETFDDEDAEKQINAAIRSLTKTIVRKRIVEEGLRIDGRTPADLRPLSSDVGIIPTAHGSGLFQRGETQVLNITTLGTKRMDQMIDGIDPITRKRYMHHYNFPPFSTGEAGFMRGPKRREIGHGALAERALLPVIPSEEEWPYTLRLVSEVMSSNGSSSMASVCSSSLSLMDAGVPIKAPVAGIAMGLVYAEGKYTALTDILGAEDAFGDMDFKVAGTSDFITALQLDTKIDGIPAEVLAAALNQAKEARLAILDVMKAAISEPRDDVSDVAPKIISFEIPLDKIGEVIGPKGKVINAMQQETGAEIIVDDDGVVGTVAIAGTDRDAVYEAERQINLILDPPTADVGETYTGKVVNITNFGAFVNILPGRDGLLHISKIGGNKRINKVEDVLELGQEVEVRVEDIDPNGKISLVPVEDGSSGDNTENENDNDEENPGKDEDKNKSTNDDPRSFEDEFEEGLVADLGDLGPQAVGRRNSGNNSNRKGKGRGGRNR